MLTLVIGGAASGKSSFAESIVTSGSSPKRVYLATMRLWDEECEQRVKRHREMRAGKLFETIECPENLEKIFIPPHAAILLEDISNLTANEFFSATGSEGTFDRIMNGIRHLNAAAEELVIVSNELFSDGMDYDNETTAYLTCLASLNLAIAEEADEVFEVVCGIPIPWKGLHRGTPVCYN